MPVPLIEMAGRKYGLLTVIARAENAPNGTARWLCQCECGGRTITSGGNLRRADSRRSCGCMKVKALIERSRTHGMSRTKEFGVWLGMINRCHLPTCSTYFKYGARGIAVCDRWRNSFADFIADMGMRPSSKYSIERINNNGNYEPSNCKWATAIEQRHNRRDTQPRATEQEAIADLIEQIEERA